MVKEGWKTCLILEDDAHFGNGFATMLQMLPDYDYINFSHATYGQGGYEFYSRVESGIKGISTGYGFWFTHAYAITQETAQLFVERLATQTDSVDCQIALIQKEIKAFSCMPSVVSQDNRLNHSSIIHTKNERNDKFPRFKKQA
jgi:GR25 family glycosyltransferase involved in LPS biosynthesis